MSKPDLTRYRLVREVEVESYPTGELRTIPIYEPDDTLQQIADEFANATSTWLDIMMDWPEMYVLLNALVEGNEDE